MRTAKTRDQGGFLAQRDGDCPVCSEPVVRLVSAIVYRRGEPVHVECLGAGE